MKNGIDPKSHPAQILGVVGFIGIFWIFGGAGLLLDAGFSEAFVWLSIPIAIAIGWFALHLIDDAKSEQMSKEAQERSIALAREIREEHTKQGE